MNKCVICGKDSGRGKTCSPKCKQIAYRNRNKEKGLMKSKVVDIGYVYLIHCIGFPYYKIGSSFQPKDRLETLQTAIPFDLELVIATPVKKMAEAEHYLHQRYEKHRIKGEWFNFNDNTLATVEARFEHVGLFYRITA